MFGIVLDYSYKARFKFIADFEIDFPIHSKFLNEEEIK